MAGLAAAFGSGAMTNTIGDIKEADFILATGTNTTENHPVISTYIKRAVKFGKTKLAVVDPRRITLTRFADSWLRQAPGTDIAWINGLMHIIIYEDLYDKKFVKERCENFEALKESVETYTPGYVSSITGIPEEDLVQLARDYAAADRGSIMYCMGITQHTSGTDQVKALANLAMLCGNLGKEGTGVNPLRGQNNVQGACDMGCLPNVFTGYQKVDSHGSIKKMEEAWCVTGLSDKPGMTATEIIPSASTGEIKSLYVIGENPLVSDPDITHVTKAFEDVGFVVVQDIFMTETAKMADVVLPATSFAEKDGTFTNSERRVQRVRKAVNGPGESRLDYEIICDLATKMGYPMSYESPREIFEEISSVTPSYGGITYDRIEKEGIFWPCPTKSHPGTPILHVDTFSRGRGLFHVTGYSEPAEIADEEFPLVLTTGRVLYQYHTGTMTRKTKDITKISPECFVEISRKDALKFKINNNSYVDVTSRRGKIKVKAQISNKAVEGTVFIPFHFAESAANMLTNSEVDPVAKIPEYKVCAIRIDN